MAEVQNYFTGISGAFGRKNGSTLARLLALPVKASDLSAPLVQVLRRLAGQNVDDTCSRFLGANDIAKFVAAVVVASMHVMNRDFDTAYKNQNDAYNLLLDIYSSKDENLNWMIPLLSRVSNDLRIVAEMSDDASNDINHTTLRESLGSLTKGFTMVAKDRTPLRQPGCKKIAIFAVTNVLFKIYFRVNTLQLCGKLISVLEGPGGIMDNLQLFPVSDVVMYKYYLGRLKMFEDRYEEARDCLMFALTYTPLSQFKNRQRILISLIPVQMVLGTMPSERVATTYKLPEFVALAKAVSLGDVRTFEEVLLRHQPSFVRIGVYLVLEHVKMIAYRSLFRRIYLLANTTRLNLSHFEAALQWLQQPSDMDEIECLLCNMISQNKVKGYISHEKRFLIVSKTEPFPKCKKA